MASLLSGQPVTSVPESKPEPPSSAMESRKGSKLGMMSGVYVPVFLNIISILMFLRFGVILGQIGFIGMMGLLVVAYSVDFLTTFSLSAIASNGEVRGGGAYYLISRSLGPEFGGSIGILFFLAQVLNTALNVVGLINCIQLYVGPAFPQGYWTGYGLQTAALMFCTALCLLGSQTFSKASSGLLAILSLAIISIPVSAVIQKPFHDEERNIHFTGFSLETLTNNFLPHTKSSAYNGVTTFRELFGILFPATSGIFAGASMSGDLKEPSKAIPKGTLWATLTTFIVYLVVILSMAASIAHKSLATNPDVIALVNISQPVILAGECAVSLFSSLMGVIGSAKLFQALARDKLVPGLSIFGKGTKKSDEPLRAIFLTYAIAQIALLADLNSIATFIAMGYQMTFFVMNLACFLLKIGSAPNFRPSFKFFNWQTALLGSLSSAAAMFFINESYAAIAICIVVFLFLLIHYLSPPKRWGDVSQNLIYHQVRKYLLRLKPEHIKFWRPQIILLVNDPRRQTRLIQFCNSLKKGSLYILGHVIITDDFGTGVSEAKLQQQAWTNYVSDSSSIKAFVQLNMAPSITWGIRNLILSAGLGGMRPNIAVLGFYNMEDLRRSNPNYAVPEIPSPPAAKMKRPPRPQGKTPQRRRGDTSSRLLASSLPTDVIRTEGMMAPTEYMTMLEDLALRYRLNVAVAYGFEGLETPHKGDNTKKYIDLWPIQMSAEITSDGKNMLTTNFDTYTLILQLGHVLHSVKTWMRAYALRIMVFVEYESEVDEESARVGALLEKLRIDAEVMVFWLASGQLNTYELIVNGSNSDIDWEIVVNDALRDEQWWDELQMLRGRWAHMSANQEREHLAHIIDSTVGRPGIYNPHDESHFDRRRTSSGTFAEVPRRPAISILSKMGINAGMHTHHLHEEVLQESDPESDSSSDNGDMDEFQHRDSKRTGSGDPTKQPLLSSLGRGRRRSGSNASSANSGGTVRGNERAERPTLPTAYGTMSTSHSVIERTAQDGKNVEEFPPFHPRTTPKLPPAETPRTQSTSPVRHSGTQTPRDARPAPLRPGMSRQSSAMRFSSRPVPETTVTVEDEGSKISFAPSRPESSRPERPPHSRQSSYGKFSSRPMPETKITGSGEEPRTISFAETPVQQSQSAAHSRHHSRQNSQYSQFGQSDLSLSVSEVSGSYRMASGEEDAPETGSPYSTQGLALSFNDLPSRAQHLILNELMRQNSRDTAVIMSTLPIPAEGTSHDNAATVQYLSDVEVLCNELPPTLMVLSNNMTVTVSI